MLFFAPLDSSLFWPSYPSLRGYVFFLTLLTADGFDKCLVDRRLLRFCNAKRCFQKGVLAGAGMLLCLCNMLLYSELCLPAACWYPAKRVENYRSWRRICRFIPTRRDNVGNDRRYRFFIIDASDIFSSMDSSVSCFLRKWLRMSVFLDSHSSSSE